MAAVDLEAVIFLRLRWGKQSGEAAGFKKDINPGSNRFFRIDWYYKIFYSSWISCLGVFILPCTQTHFFLTSSFCSFEWRQPFRGLLDRKISLRSKLFEQGVINERPYDVHIKKQKGFHYITWLINCIRSFLLVVACDGDQIVGSGYAQLRSAKLTRPLRPMPTWDLCIKYLLTEGGGSIRWLFQP